MTASRTSGSPRFVWVPMCEAFYRLSSKARLTWFGLCSFASRENRSFGSCFPSRAALSKRTGLSKVSLSAAFKELEREGLIQRAFRVALSTVYEPGPALQDLNGVVQNMKGDVQDMNEDVQNVNGVVQNLNTNSTINNIKEQDQGTEDCTSAAARPDRRPPVNLAQVMGLWNERLTPLGFPLVVKGTPARRRALSARLNEDPQRRDLAWWEALMDRAAGSDFLTRSAEEGARWLNFDWLLKEDSLVKLAEGRYEGANVASVPRSGLGDYLRELAKDPYFGGDAA